MVLQNSSTLKNQKPMILMEFIKNIVTICFPIPKSVIKNEKVKKVILILRNYDKVMLSSIHSKTKYAIFLDVDIEIYQSSYDTFWLEGRGPWGLYFQYLRSAIPAATCAAAFRGYCCCTVASEELGFESPFLSKHCSKWFQNSLDSDFFFWLYLPFFNFLLIACQFNLRLFYVVMFTK